MGEQRRSKQDGGTVGGPWVWLLDGQNCSEAEAAFSTLGLSCRLWFLCCFQDAGMGAVPKNVHQLQNRARDGAHEDVKLPKRAHMVAVIFGKCAYGFVWVGGSRSGLRTAAPPNHGTCTAPLLPITSAFAGLLFLPPHSQCHPSQQQPVCGRFYFLLFLLHPFSCLQAQHEVQ